jgi:type IV fimbrial biogenesis protein FimT
MARATRQRRTGFTVIEALVTVAILGIVLAVAVPSAVDWIRIQRVKASAAELAADIQFARAEAVRRNWEVAIKFESNGQQACYTVHTTNVFGMCSCLLGEGNACPEAHSDNRFELKTVALPGSAGVSMAVNQNLAFESVRALPKGLDEIGLSTGVSTLQADIDGGSMRQLRVVTNTAGRPHICAPSGSKIVGFAPCS